MMEEITENNKIYNNKQCNCTFCYQFLFNRIKNYKHNNKIFNSSSNSNSNYPDINNDKTITDKQNDKTYFTLNDYSNVKLLKSLECDTTEISKQTNLPYSIVEYIISLIS